MNWWNDFISWVTAADTRPTLFIAAVIAVSIILSGLIAAGIGRSGIKRLIAQRDREQRSAAIATLIDAATEATVWNSLTPQERVLADRAVGQADTVIRLLPVKGSSIAADWASHQLAEMKRASSRSDAELDAVVGEFRDRLLDWQERPSRARKVFQSDLERWAFSGESEGIASNNDASVEQRLESATPAASALRYSETSPADATTQKLIDDVAALEAAKKRQQSTATDDETGEKSAS
ncbi:hypothetical protein [Paramicrobacterium agarici]|uniref:hypothetical protein n=1 Tax=Paramicrobacterium agarici TaxID=630514 RepID=UPI001153C254|nr:hypothetical protein [Microbacterium agarici]TQO24195.1 hypothetical protein FB385_3071 [Microbacterium agarici]